MPKRTRVFQFTMALVVTLAGAPFSEGVAQLLNEDDALAEDARSYSLAYGVDEVEASQRLKFQTFAGALSQELAERERSTFAGLWIEHSPAFKVVVLFTDGAAEKRIQRYVGSTLLAELVEVQHAEKSLVRLEADQALASSIAERAGVRVDTSINVYENRVELYTIDRFGLEAALAGGGLRLPRGVAITEVDELAEPLEPLYGGQPLSTCTSGFSVQATGGSRGVLTAGHCPNAQSDPFCGGLTFRTQRCDNGYDVQWHSGCCPRRKFYTGQGLSNVTATKSRASQAVGEFVCRFGKTSGRTCGNITSKTYQPGYPECSPHTATYVRVAAGAAPGDSGGPVFSGSTAYGITICSAGAGHYCYMAIDFISVLGLTVMTSDPPGCKADSQVCQWDCECCSGYCWPVSGGGGVKVCRAF